MKLLTQEEADKESCVFVGMWRPPFYEVQGQHSENTYRMTPESTELRQCYLRGDFDEPLYKRVVGLENQTK